MRYGTILATALLLILTGPGRGIAHDQSTRDYADAIRKAKAVAVAEVVTKHVDEERCNTTFRFELKTIEALRGSVEIGLIFPFSYTIHYWKRAIFPWQEDCPSVHYRLPPIAENMNVGSKVIITLEFWEPGKTDAVMSTRDISRLDEVKRLIRGR